MGAKYDDRGDPGRPRREGRRVPRRRSSRPSPRPTTRCSRSTSAARSSRSPRSRARSASSPSTRRSTPCSAAPRSRTAACSRCSTRSSTTSPPRSTCPPSRRTTSATRRRSSMRHADATEPFSALAFKVAVHPFFGRLTYVRVYSGHLDSGAQVINSTKGKKERIGKIFQMHSNKENPVDSVTAGHIYAVIGLKDTTTGDTLCDPTAPGRPRVDDVPGARHRGRDRAEDQGRPGEARHRDPEARRGGPDLPHRAEPGDRSDGHQGNGRAPPRHPGRPHEARVQRRGQRRQAAGGLPRDDPQTVEKSRLHPQEADGWFRPVREGPDLARAARGHGREDLRVRQRGHRWSRPARVHPLGRRRHPGRHAGRRPRRLPDGRRQGDPARRRGARRRLLGDGVQDRRLDGVQGGRSQGAARSCSSRSWPSRSARPRSTWATSSAT